MVITHPKGHVIPQLPPPDLARLAAFLDEQRGAIAAAERGEERPGAASASCAAAGRAGQGSPQAAGSPGSRL